ncbi:MAG: ABC transporter ATP-binding protein [Alphaproteobacteria bacterium]|nr:ABC transporter ATP-binding protein [Alphaproteobacteria bacterium]
MPEAVIQLESICKEYEQAEGAKTQVLKSVDLVIEEGEFVAIMGPSGSGKSTLMNLLGTLDRPTSGTYTLIGEDINDYNERGLAEIRNKTIGFVFQGFNLLARRTIIENIALPLRYAGMNGRESLLRAEEFLDKVGLSTHRNYLPTQLSGGQQQRVAIARALAGDPKLILADEPTGNLDSKTSKEIMQLFCELHESGITIILITHEQDVARYAERLVQVKDGEIIYDGPMY